MATVHYLDLPKELENMEIPKKFQTIFGSKALTRILTFVDHFQVTNDDYDNLMAIKPPRQNGESKEQYALRSKLQKLFGKYKWAFYDYSVYEKKKQELKTAA